MIRRFGIRSDPFEGRGARRTYFRLRAQGAIALGLAIAACGLTAAWWLLTVAPSVVPFGGH